MNDTDQAMLQANPHIVVLLLMFVGLVGLILSSFLVLWITVIVRLSKRAPILPLEAWTPRAWGLIDILLIVASAFIGQAILIRSWANLSGIDLREMIESDKVSLSVMAVGSLSFILAMLAGVAWLILRFRATFEHFGLSLRQIRSNLFLGLCAAAMTLPIVAAMSAAVNVGLDTEYKHPLIEELKSEGTVSAYLLAVFCAVVVAPLVEEFLFRVLLQGWLQSLPWSVGSWWWLLGSSPAQSQELMQHEGLADSTAALAADPLASPFHSVASSASETEPSVLLNPYASQGEPELPVHGSFEPPKPPIWPALVAGILFGLAHFDYGFSFIPLSFLGVVLGLLYRARHSIWPCLVMHFALNAMSMAALGLNLLMESAK